MTARVLITVWLDCGHKLEYKDRIEEKYPFDYCSECEEPTDRTGKYPWRLDTQIIEEAGHWQDTTSGRVFVADA